ncbi:unnamed protein product [Kluyveromyces dobzhanskii CBS 2104]|uniref:WGS project CCBQ000000000 data, contig 00015 n=1 Tax=Kluyveromyces dobzhanskii CBS 2104 TaxID=1427455 RepID=A0A0A8LCG8_9SACH|nr:unnamed protein product [Kluyveromyces dobzhanskii CBS 2104]
MLYISVLATLSENIRRVFPKDTEQSPAEYTFRLVCTNCREDHDAPIRVNRFESHDMPGSKGKASFVMKCKFCGQECSINLTRTKEDLNNLDEETNLELIEQTKKDRKKNGLKSVPIEQALWLGLDCRGCEVTKFETADTTFVAELVSKKEIEFQFEDDENEWYDYDEDAGEVVSVVDMQFDVIKGK